VQKFRKPRISKDMLHSGGKKNENLLFFADVNFGRHAANATSGLPATNGEN